MAFWDKWEKGQKTTVIQKGSGTGGVYFFAGLGVLIYYLNVAHTFTDVVLAFIKAIFWPAFISFHVYGLLGMH